MGRGIRRISHIRNPVVAPSPVVINHSGKVELPFLKRSDDQANFEKETKLETRSPYNIARLNPKDLNALEAATNTGFPPWMHSNEPSRRALPKDKSVVKQDSKHEEKKMVDEKKDNVVNAEYDDSQALEKRMFNSSRSGKRADKIPKSESSLGSTPGTRYYTPSHDVESEFYPTYEGSAYDGHYGGHSGGHYGGTGAFIPQANPSFDKELQDRFKDKTFSSEPQREESSDNVDALGRRLTQSLSFKGAKNKKANEIDLLAPYEGVAHPSQQDRGGFSYWSENSPALHEAPSNYPS